MSKTLNIAKEFLRKEVKIIIDRPLGSKHPKYGFVYEVNYGYLPNVKATDGEDLDAYYLGTDKPLVTANGVCVAIVHRLDDDDDKLVVVPAGFDLSDEEIKSKVNFQEKFFQIKIIR